MTQVNPSAVLSLADAVGAYLDWHALRGSSAAHRKELRRMLLAFVELTEDDQPIIEVTREHCTAYLRSVQERGGKPNTQNAYYRTLTAFFRWLCQEKRIGTSPMERVPAPKVPLEQIKPLTPDELGKLLRQPDVTTFTGLRDATFIALLADSGLRLSEATSIKVSEIDLKQRAVAVVGKGGRPRVVFFGDTAARYLREYLKRRDAGPEDLVFISSLGEPMCRYTMTTRLRRYGQEAGIVGKRVSPHTLRHTFAVSWLIGGGDALSLQRLLGHSTQVMTARYVNFTATDLAELHRKISPLDRLWQMGGTFKLPRQGRNRLR